MLNYKSVSKQKNQKVLYRWHAGMMFGCHSNFYSSFFKRSVIFFNSARIAFIVVSFCFVVDQWLPTTVQCWGGGSWGQGFGTTAVDAFSVLDSRLCCCHLMQLPLKVSNGVAVCCSISYHFSYLDGAGWAITPLPHTAWHKLIGLILNI